LNRVAFVLYPYKPTIFHSAKRRDASRWSLPYCIGGGANAVAKAIARTAAASVLASNRVNSTMRDKTSCSRRGLMPGVDFSSRMRTSISSGYLDERVAQETRAAIFL
jgi:hypothetical protein